LLSSEREKRVVRQLLNTSGAAATLSSSEIAQPNSEIGGTAFFLSQEYICVRTKLTNNLLYF